MAASMNTDGTKLEKVCFPLHEDPAAKWDVKIEGGCASFTNASTANHASGLILPPLCHPHIHLDKAYILTGNNNQPNQSGWPDYSDLLPTTGSFSEALQNTTEAKNRYTREDIQLRGNQLIANCVKHGVTSMRAFAEVDHVTQSLALSEAIRLKREWDHLMDVQICAFAQDPLFSTEHGERNRQEISQVLTSQLRENIGAIGTTPYVEDSREAALQNIDFAIDSALTHRVHLDFHLDYNLKEPSGDQAPLVYDVIEKLKKHDWLKNADPNRTIVLGHCTQLTQLSNAEMSRLAELITGSKLPIHFVGLPTSDLYMMGRPSAPLTDASASSQNRPRGTLNVPSLIKDHGLNACLGVNNVGNAFTPYGTGDPLQLASWGVGLYHAGTVEDARLLYGCVSWRARAAIGLSDPDGEGADYNAPSETGRMWKPALLIRNESSHRFDTANARGDGVRPWVVPARQRRSIQDVVWDPPETSLRSTVRYSS